MAKQVILGDIHGRTIWNKILAAESDADRVIFIGDYLDTHEDISGIEQLQNLEDVINFKRNTERNTDKEVILLIGNHDHHYFPRVGYTGTSGYQSKMAIEFGAVLQKNLNSFQMCFEDEHNTLYSHAGVSKTWFNKVKRDILDPRGISHEPLHTALNMLFRAEPKAFCYNNIDGSGYGQHQEQTPIWIRPESLYSSQIDVLQVVGHTQVNKISHPLKSERRGFYMIDALGTTREYLVCMDGKFEIKQQLN
jgi:hypothetical protein